ncbi:xylan 1,4-beta-xylosidase [Aureococcus anophagefferens]|nr:xylan 1,4-beta-xylosidase [Aureococcus anophagefferens]
MARAATVAALLLLPGVGAQPAAGGLVNPCLNATFEALPFCDATLAIDLRAADAVSRMTIPEKIDALDTKTGPIASLGLPAYNWWSEASSGVMGSRPTTKFAYPITTAMSFNRTLWRATGAAIGREARALMNAGAAYSTYWAPVVNLAREPRWGRNIEVPGEDPYLTGEYATEFASACCKHYVANELENTRQPDGEQWDRQHVDSNVTQRDLVDSYMVPFQACVEKGKVSSLMCSYNAVNGVPSCANDWLLQTVARDAWHFDGYITSDCDADSNVYDAHHYAATPEEAVADVLKAGTDVDCQSFVGQHARSALDKGLITEADMDARLVNLFKVRLRLGHFDLSFDAAKPRGPLDEIDADAVVCSDAHLDASMEGLAQSATLLKNDGALPLKPSGTAAVVGPNALLSKADAGYYGPTDVCGGDYWTLLDAVADGAPSPRPRCSACRRCSAATSRASRRRRGEGAGAVVLAVGTDLTWAAEGKDATSIVFTAAQLELIDAVATASATPVVVVVFSATPLDLTPLLARSDGKVGAVVHVGQPSVTVKGLGDLLYGRRSFAGRAVQTVYPAAYADQISIFDFNMRPGPSAFARPDCATNESACPRGTNPGRTYRFYVDEPVVPFGFGLSYTTFAYAVRLHDDAAAATYAVDVTNTGDIDADDVVLGFVTPPGAGVDGVTLKELFGFERVHVKAGETKTVYLYPALSKFKTVAEDGALAARPGDYAIEFGIPETRGRMGCAAATLAAF